MTRNDIRIIGDEVLISLQHASDMLPMEANHLGYGASQYGAFPYYQDPDPNSAHLRYVEFRIFVALMKAYGKTIFEGLKCPHPDPKERRNEPKDNPFNARMREHLFTANLWTSEQAKIQPTMEFRPRMRNDEEYEEKYFPPLPWPVVEGEERQTVIEFVAGKRDADREIIRKIVHEEVALILPSLVVRVKEAAQRAVAEVLIGGLKQQEQQRVKA